MQWWAHPLGNCAKTYPSPRVRPRSPCTASQTNAYVTTNISYIHTEGCYLVIFDAALVISPFQYHAVMSTSTRKLHKKTYPTPRVRPRSPLEPVEKKEIAQQVRFSLCCCAHCVPFGCPDLGSFWYVWLDLCGIYGMLLTHWFRLWYPWGVPDEWN